MDTITRIYRDEILRAVLGDKAHEVPVADQAKLDQLATHMADGMEANRFLRARGYGAPGKSVADAARAVPENVRQLLHDIWSPR
jgi:hypothetical protein